MKKLSLLAFGVASLLMVGGGCSSSVPSTTTDVSDTTPAVQKDSSPTPSVASSKTWAFPGTLPAEQIHGKQIRITTAKGDVVFTLFDDTAPMTVSNFVSLATGGFYDGLTFHRRESWVLQGGDPNGTGTGGPGYAFDDELKDNRTYVRGIVAMANSGVRGGKGTNGSQFWIMTQSISGLDKAYTIFGEVTEGMDVVDQLTRGDVMTKVTVEDAK